MSSKLLIVSAMILGMVSAAKADVTCTSDSPKAEIKFSSTQMTIVSGLSGLGIADDTACAASSATSWSLSPLGISDICQTTSMELDISAGQNHLTVTSGGFPVFSGPCR